MKSYYERVKRMDIINCLPDRECVKYENKIIGCTFYGLNYFGMDSWFSLTEIDEANAFTINAKDVAIIPFEFYDLAMKLAKTPWRIDIIYKMFMFQLKIKRMPTCTDQ